MKSSYEREALRKYIDENILESREVLDILGVTRQRLNIYVKDGRLKTIRSGIYLKSDVEAFHKAFNEARNEGKWLKGIE